MNTRYKSEIFFDPILQIYINELISQIKKWLPEIEKQVFTKEEVIYPTIYAIEEYQYQMLQNFHDQLLTCTKRHDKILTTHFLIQVRELLQNDLINQHGLRHTLGKFHYYLENKMNKTAYTRQSQFDYQFQDEDFALQTAITRSLSTEKESTQLEKPKIAWKITQFGRPSILDKIKKILTGSKSINKSLMPTFGKCK